MKFSRVAAALVIASMASPLFAAGTVVGKVNAATKGTFIARDGKLIPAVAGQALYAGDRVVTRANAAAKISMTGCTASLTPTSIVSVGTSCTTPTSLAVAQEEGAGGGGIGSTGYIVGGLAALGVVGGIVAATSNNNSSPTSP